MKGKNIIVVVLVLLAGAILVSAQNAAQQQRTIVLRGGLLIDGTGSAPVTNSVIVISAGKIQSVGREGAVTVPANATIIDAAGKTIIPGLVDTHVHLRNYHAASYLYWGVTSIGDLGNSLGWILSYRDGIAKRRIAGPYIMAAGPKLSRPPKPKDALAAGDMREFDTFLSGNSQMGYVTDQASADRVIGELKKEGVDGIKIYTRMEPALMKITAAAAHRQGLPVFAHYGNFLSSEDIIDTGIDAQAHLNGLVMATIPADLQERFARSGGQMWHLMDTSKFPALAQKMIDKHMFLQATVKREFERVSKHYDEFARLNNTFVKSPVVAKLPPEIRARYEDAFKPAAGEGGRNARGPEQTQQLAEGFRKASMFVKEYADRGGKVIAGSDYGASGGSPGLTLHEELVMLTETGMKPMQVIQSATSWAMEAWGKSKEAGTVEAGKRADLLVLNRNPLDDMSATTDIYRVIQGGSVVDRENLGNVPEPLPRPMPVQSGNFPNLLLRIPFVVEVHPEAVPATAKSPSELTITGENFGKNTLVLLNDRLVTAKLQNNGELRVSVPADIQKKPGVYSLVLVEPGSAGGISNPVYLIVTPD